MKNNFKLLTAFLLLSAGASYGQTGVGTTTPDTSAVLDVSSTTKGFLLPRHTTISRDAIVNPAKGLMIFNTTSNQLETNTGTSSTPVWTASGVGATGPQGPQGIQGLTGATGATGSQGPIGLTGPAGADGTDGLSAYQIWLNAGNTGTQVQFLAAIKGADGATGATGPQGIQGLTGPSGADGVGGVTTAGTNITITGSGSVASPYVVNATATTASNGLTETSGNVKLGGTLTAATTVEQGSNNLTFSGTGRTIVGGSFQTQGLLYAKAPRVHPISSSITWQADDVVILLQSTHSGNIVFPSASANPNRLIGINNRSGSARLIANVTGGDTGIYADEALSQIASNSGVSWYVSDGTSWRLYSGRP